MKQGNQLLTLMSLHPKRKWDWDGISDSKLMSIGLLLEFPTAPWNWTTVSINTNISDEDILANLHLSWDWRILSNSRRYITLDFIRKVEAVIPPPWNYTALSQNRCITWEFVQERITEAWDWPMLTIALGWDVVLANLNAAPWNFYQVSSSPHLTWAFVLEHINVPWDWDRLSGLTCIRCDDIVANKDCPWNWDIITRRNDLTWRVVAATLDKPWDWINLSARLVLDDEAVDFAVQCQDFWHYGSLSCVRDTSFRIVDALPNKPWNWEYLSRNENITFDIVYAYPDVQWKWQHVSHTLHKRATYTTHQKRLIYKFYNKVKLSIQRRKRVYQHCMLAIRMKPEIGVDYFAIKDEVESIGMLAI